jgi:sigma-B regulation protein RsbU (phosphoserine phosphatase)
MHWNLHRYGNGLKATSLAPDPWNRKEKRFDACLKCSGTVDSVSLENLMPSTQQSDALDQSSLSLAEQVVRLQALLEASRSVHSTIELTDVLQQSARIAVRELELDGALFTMQNVGYGNVPAAAVAEPCDACPRFELLSRDGKLLSELVVATPGGRPLSLYERDFLEGLVLQTAVAVENAINHERHLNYARLAQDLDAARAIQQSLLPQTMPSIPGYSVAARSRACYQVGGDYLDVVTEPDGSHLMVIADVAGKGLASALVCTAFRSAFRALARQSLTLRELAGRLSQQHWEEGSEARRRYVTAIFLRLDPASSEMELVNAGHNPAFLVSSGETPVRLIEASGTPLGMLPGSRYSVERVPIEPGARILLYTDGLTEIFQGEEEFGQERLMEAFRAIDTASDLPAEDALANLWTTLDTFSGGAPQQDDMSAIALCRLTSKSKEKASL